METLVLGAVLGAALALAVQVVLQRFIMPWAERRKRREVSWESDVRELRELLSTSLSDRATGAQAAQGLFEDLRQLAEEVGQNPDRIEKFREKHIWETRKVTRAFTDLAHTRVGLLTDRIVALRPTADVIAEFERVSRTYWLRVAIASTWDEGDDPDKVQKRWQGEYEARQALDKQVKLLADLPHPPRVSLRRRWKRRCVTFAHRAAAIWARRTSLQQAR